MSDAGKPIRGLLLVRHGQSETNAANVFTGWSDPGLTAKGIAEAERVAEVLEQANLPIAIAYTSALVRASHSAEIILDRLGSHAELIRSNALDERDYGALTGLNKAEAAERYGKDQVHSWRRSFAERPPNGESLRDTAARVLAYFVQAVLPSVLDGGNVLVVAHGNSLRALVMALDHLSAEEVAALEIGTGSVIAYVLDSASRVVSKEMLLDRVGVD